MLYVLQHYRSLFFNSEYTCGVVNVAYTLYIQRGIDSYRNYTEVNIFISIPPNGDGRDMFYHLWLSIRPAFHRFRRWKLIFTERGYAKRGICRRRVSVCLCVCHTPVLYQNG